MAEEKSDFLRLRVVLPRHGQQTYVIVGMDSTVGDIACEVASVLSISPENLKIFTETGAMCPLHYHANLLLKDDQLIVASYDNIVNHPGAVGKPAGPVSTDLYQQSTAAGCIGMVTPMPVAAHHHGYVQPAGMFSAGGGGYPMVTPSQPYAGAHVMTHCMPTPINMHTSTGGDAHAAAHSSAAATSAGSGTFTPDRPPSGRKSEVSRKRKKSLHAGLEDSENYTIDHSLKKSYQRPSAASHQLSSAAPVPLNLSTEPSKPNPRLAAPHDPGHISDADVSMDMPERIPSPIPPQAAAVTSALKSSLKAHSSKSKQTAGKLHSKPNMASESESSSDYSSSEESDSDSDHRPSSRQVATSTTTARTKQQQQQQASKISNSNTTSKTAGNKKAATNSGSGVAKPIVPSKDRTSTKMTSQSLSAAAKGNKDRDDSSSTYSSTEESSSEEEQPAFAKGSVATKKAASVAKVPAKKPSSAEQGTGKPVSVVSLAAAAAAAKKTPAPPAESSESSSSYESDSGMETDDDAPTPPAPAASAVPAKPQPPMNKGGFAGIRKKSSSTSISGAGQDSEVPESGGECAPRTTALPNLRRDAKASTDQSTAHPHKADSKSAVPTSPPLITSPTIVVNKTSDASDSSEYESTDSESSSNEHTRSPVKAVKANTNHTAPGKKPAARTTTAVPASNKKVQVPIKDESITASSASESGSEYETHSEAESDRVPPIEPSGKPVSSASKSNPSALPQTPKKRGATPAQTPAKVATSQKTPAAAKKGGAAKKTPAAKATPKAPKNASSATKGAKKAGGSVGGGSSTAVSSSRKATGKSHLSRLTWHSQ
ncbi:nucleolar protein dao-5-like isoform X2 [Sycon ciliatum]|uniref:nucleolar protein dao-5-like isoform X2 n=1 Tax=Sycon ciliatum TaxID=27933 RepID=UPI0031F636CF